MPGRPRGLYEEEGEPFNPGFLAKASELADRSIEPAAANARPRRTAGADREAPLDVFKVRTTRAVARAVGRDQKVTSKVPAVI
jgi:hypothetical protein